MTAATLRIGEVSERTGVTVETLRYYERQGLLAAPPRTTGGIRRYSINVVERVEFIKQAQRLGLTLSDIRQVSVAQRGRGRIACANIRKVLSERITELDGRLAELQTFREVLCDHLRACDRALDDEKNADCPTMERLAGAKQ